MVKVAIVGVGNIGNTHARCYQENRHARIVAVCDIIKEKADAAAELYGAKAFYSIQEMVDSGVKIDAASMCTKGEENGGDHFKPTMELLEAGIPTLGEKPISNKIPQARKMVALAKEKGIAYGVNLNHRFTPSLVNMTMWINNPVETSPHFHIRALHPHSLDVMRYFAGDYVKAQCFFRKGAGRKIWSNLQANLLFKNGVLGHLTGSYDAGGSYGLETLELVGSEGRVVINEACEKLQRSRVLRSPRRHAGLPRHLRLPHRGLGRRHPQGHRARGSQRQSRGRAQSPACHRGLRQVMGDEHCGEGAQGVMIRLRLTEKEIPTW